MNRGAVVDFKPAAGTIAVQVSFGIGRRTVHEVSPFPQDPALDRLIAGPRRKWMISTSHRRKKTVDLVWGQV
jgi:hypothetical protein